MRLECARRNRARVLSGKRAAAVPSIGPDSVDRDSPSGGHRGDHGYGGHLRPGPAACGSHCARGRAVKDKEHDRERGDEAGRTAQGVAGTEDQSANGGTGNLTLTSNITGTASIVEIVGGTGLTALGLTAAKTTGLDRRITMQTLYTEFTHADNGGDTTYYYQVRYYNSDTGVYSDFSDPIPGEQVSPLAASLITATIDLVALDGTPMADTLITISNAYDATALVVSSHGVLGESVEFHTDASGHGEIDLVEGSIVDVSISGTGITRQITVPVGATFDLMASVAAADDLFQIQTPDIPDAIRRA